MFKLFLTIITCSGVILLMPLQIFAQEFENYLLTSQNAESQLYQEAFHITVKVIAGENWGSGVIVNKQEQIYTILTNRHVLTPSDYHQIQTYDSEIYNASLVYNSHVEGNDLAVLQFQSEQNYKVVTIANSVNLSVGEDIFAIGFPLLTQDYNPNDQGFVFTQGQISLILDQPLQEGYQLGYTNNINKGMSGGAILNIQGELIGINGRHAYPLWGDPFIYEDGSKPNEQLRQQMIPISWGIPSNTFIFLLDLHQTFLENNIFSSGNIDRVIENSSNTITIENILNNQFFESNINQNNSNIDLFRNQQRELPAPYSHNSEYLW